VQHRSNFTLPVNPSSAAPALIRRAIAAPRFRGFLTSVGRFLFRQSAIPHLDRSGYIPSLPPARPLVILRMTIVIAGLDGGQRSVIGRVHSINGRNLDMTNQVSIHVGDTGDSMRTPQLPKPCTDLIDRFLLHFTPLRENDILSEPVDVVQIAISLAGHSSCAGNREGIGVIEHAAHASPTDLSKECKTALPP
jgi:hypothetical protein